MQKRIRSNGVQSFTELRGSLDALAAGEELHAWIRDWYPIPRSLSGAGIREQFARMQAHIPLTLTQVVSGSPAFDWTVPLEWNIRDAYIKNGVGERVVNYNTHNLHVMAYSKPIHQSMTLDDLRPHLHTLPEQPDLIPYRTSYFNERWAFCLPHRLLESMPEGDYEVMIDSTLENGHLTYAECVIPGETEEEFLFSAHACHPSLANDNLSGLALATWLARALHQVPHRYTYRFVFAPGTIGAITWLSRNLDVLPRVRHGLVLALLGDPAPFTYKQSRRATAEIDHIVAHVLNERATPHAVIPFIPYGYDERQYCSPGINLPMGCLMRSQPGTFPEYHTSADNLDFVKPAALAESLELLLNIVEVAESNRRYLNLQPCGEPQLGKRGLYTSFGSPAATRAFELALLWVLSYCDGDHDLLDIAQRSGKTYEEIHRAAKALLDAGLLREAAKGERLAALT